MLALIASVSDSPIRPRGLAWHQPDFLVGAG